MDDTTSPDPSNGSVAPTTTAEPADADNTAKEQRGRPFLPGQSGNPKGRPKGSRNRTTLAMEAVIEEHCEEIAKKAIETGLEGDASILRALVQRLVPPRRDRPVEFELPPINTAADAAVASNAILAACADGNLTLGEAHQAMELIAGHVQTIEVVALEQRIRDLENKHERP
jgi:uncharacterized protein DUF5681